MAALRKYAERTAMSVPHLVSERQLQDAIVQVARLHGWFVHHHFDARRSEPGWPDLVLIRPPVALFVELKSETGKVTAQQARVLELLEACGLDARVWRPHQLDDAIALLTERG